MADTFFDTAAHCWQHHALPWLAQLDAGHHAGCWQASASCLQHAIALADWQATLQTLPPRHSRQLFACQHYRQQPDATPCWVYQCLSADQQQETLTLQHQDNGSWKVAGYFVSNTDAQHGGLG